VKLAIVRVRGKVRVRGGTSVALEHLRLRKKNHCVVLEQTPAVTGVLRTVQGFVTWGLVAEETLKALKKREHDKVYTLNPPRKGYGRKGIKMPFSKGGALGDRKEKINDLLMRMI
jgi:large subunit ribosomal protein L30